MNGQKLNRGNLRDLVIGLCLISAYFFNVNYFQAAVALLVLSAGTALHVVTKATLVRNRVLCTEGVYRLCRHPYYLANFLVDVSLCLMSGNIYLVLAYPILFFWAYGPTLRSEEEKLAQAFGPEFHEFVLRTPQIFPHAASLVGVSEMLKEVSTTRVTRKEWVRITRFWAVGLLLPVIRDVSANGLKTLYTPPIDLDSLIIGAVAMALLLAGLIIRMLPKPTASV